MRIRVFMSNPKPCDSRQREFVDDIRGYFATRDIEPHTLGASDYDMDAPFEAIRRIMLESNGVLVVAFRRYHIEKGAIYYCDGNGTEASSEVTNEWLTSPWCHIECGMGFQLGLPLLIFREKGVRAEGVLQRGVTGTYLPEFDIDRPSGSYLKSEEWGQLIRQFEGKVREFREKKGKVVPWFR